MERSDFFDIKKKTLECFERNLNFYNVHIVKVETTNKLKYAYESIKNIWNTTVADFFQKR